MALKTPIPTKETTVVDNRRLVWEILFLLKPDPSRIIDGINQQISSDDDLLEVQQPISLRASRGSTLRTREIFLFIEKWDPDGKADIQYALNTTLKLKKLVSVPFDKGVEADLHVFAAVNMRSFVESIRYYPPGCLGSPSSSSLFVLYGKEVIN